MLTPSQFPEFERRKSDFRDLLREELNSGVVDKFPALIKATFVLIDHQLSIGFQATQAIGDLSESFQAQLGTQLFELKRLLRDPDYGAWISFDLMIDHQNDSYLYLFNHDEYLPRSMGNFTSEEFVNELIYFPRPDENIPEWWKDKIRQHMV